METWHPEKAHIIKEAHTKGMKVNKIIEDLVITVTLNMCEKKITDFTVTNCVTTRKMKLLMWAIRAGLPFLIVEDLMLCKIFSDLSITLLSTWELLHELPPIKDALELEVKEKSKL
eukprot:m51a1_g10884 hypothetical protein (116) ;mRNA; r:23998-24345